MARGLNRVTLLGNLGNDPEIRYSQAGSAVATMSVATTRAWKDRQTGELKEDTSWHRVKAFGRTAEICGEYLAKGRQVFIEGRLEYGSYEKDGVKHYTTDIIAEDVQLLGGRDGGASSGGGGQPTGGQGRAPQRQAPAREPVSREAPHGFDVADDDIPF